MSALRIGIIGCGRMGHERASACQALGHQVALLHDVDASRAAALHEACPSSAVVTCFDEAEWAQLDAVFLCTPPAIRAEYLLAFVDVQLPFLVEKPIALSADETELIAAELARRPVVHAVGYMNRCRGSVRQARELASESRVLGAAIHWLGRPYAVPWWADPRRSGGPINEQATHLVDLCRVLLGEVASVHAIAGPPLEGGPEGGTVCITLGFTTGRAATIFYSCCSIEPAKHIGLRLFTARGSLELAGWDFALTPHLPDSVEIAPDTIPIFVRETDRFLRSVERRDPAGVACTYADAVRTQAVVDAIRQSLRSGEPVTFEPLTMEILQ